MCGRSEGRRDGAEKQRRKQRPFSVLPAEVTSIKLDLASGAVTEGDHAITWALTDRAGNAAGDTLSYCIDTQDPTLTILSPEPGDIIETDTFQFSATVSDPSPNCGWGGVSFVPAANVSNIVFQGSSLTATVQLADGNGYTLSATVSDAAGNYTIRTVTDLTVESNPPLILLIYPLDGIQTFNRDQGVCFVAMFADLGSGLKSAWFEVDGAQKGKMDFPAEPPRSSYLLQYCEALAGGAHSAVAKGTDQTNRLGQSSHATFSVDVSYEIGILMNNAFSDHLHNTIEEIRDAIDAMKDAAATLEDDDRILAADALVGIVNNTYGLFDPVTRASAVEALGLIGAPLCFTDSIDCGLYDEVAGLLNALVNDPSLLIQMAAAAAMGEIGDGARFNGSLQTMAQVAEAPAGLAAKKSYYRINGVDVCTIVDCSDDIDLAARRHLAPSFVGAHSDAFTQRAALSKKSSPPRPSGTLAALFEGRPDAPLLRRAALWLQDFGLRHAPLPFQPGPLQLTGSRAPGFTLSRATLETCPITPKATRLALDPTPPTWSCPVPTQTAGFVGTDSDPSTASSQLSAIHLSPHKPFRLSFDFSFENGPEGSEVEFYPLDFSLVGGGGGSASAPDSGASTPDCRLPTPDSGPHRLTYEYHPSLRSAWVFLDGEPAGRIHFRRPAP